MCTPPARLRRLVVLIVTTLAALAAPFSSPPFTASRAFAQTGGQTVVTPAVIPVSDPDLVNPLRGLYRWRDQEKVDVVAGTPDDTYDDYERFEWRDLEGATPAADDSEYNFFKIDDAIATAMATTDTAGNPKPRQRLIFGIREQAGPGDMRVPAYLLDNPQVTYTANGRKFVMWNSSYFLERRRALFAALGRRYDGDPRVAMVQILGSQFGEWTGYSPLCNDTYYPQPQTKKELVDMVVDNFPTTRLLIGSQDSDIALYGLQRSPRIGWFRNSLGDTSFNRDLVQNYNPANFGAGSCNRTGTAAKWNYIRTRWRTAPVMTEFFYKTNPSDITPLLEQAVNDVATWHVSQVSNGNISLPLAVDQQNTLRSVGKGSGYRMVLARVAYPSTVAAGESISFTADWRNDGVAPAYEPWSIVYQLRPAGAPVTTAPQWEGTSAETLENLITQDYNDDTFQKTGPNTPETVADSFVVPQNLAGGEYDVSIIVRDPRARATPAPAFVRPPMKLAIEGARSDGSYSLGTLNIASDAVPTPSSTPTTLPETATPSPSPTQTPSPTPVPSTPTPVPSSTATQTPSPTVVPSSTATPVPSSTATPSPSPTVVPSSTATPVPSSTATPSPSPTLVPSPTQTLPPSPTPAAQQFEAVADSYVRGGATTSTYGTAPALEVRDGTGTASDHITYMRFDLSSLPVTAASRALLTFNVTAIGDTSRPANVAVFAVQNDAWSEAGINWNNRPPMGGAALATVAVTAGQGSIDLTPFVSSQLGGDKIVSIALTGVASNNNLVTIASRNNTSGIAKPRLQVTPARRILQSAGADAYVRAGASQNQQYGSAPVLEVKDSPSAAYDRQAYLRFDLRSQNLSGVQKATLWLYHAALPNNRASNVQVRAVAADNWSESSITWTNKPATGSQVASASVQVTQGAWIAFDVTAYVNTQLAVANDKQASLVLLDTTVSDSLVPFNSRENTANRPVLELIVP